MGMRLEQERRQMRAELQPSPGFHRPSSSDQLPMGTGRRQLFPERQSYNRRVGGWLAVCRSSSPQVAIVRSSFPALDIPEGLVIVRMASFGATRRL